MSGRSGKKANGNATIDAILKELNEQREESRKQAEAMQKLQAELNELRQRAVPPEPEPELTKVDRNGVEYSAKK